MEPTPQTSTSPTLPPEAVTPTAVVEDERVPTSGEEETVGTADLDSRSIADNSVSGPPAPTAEAAQAQQQQQGMIYPSTEATVSIQGEQQMLYFNPAAAGYSNSSQGFDPREGYPVVYPYVPVTLPREKKKKAYCC